MTSPLNWISQSISYSTRPVAPFNNYLPGCLSIDTGEEVIEAAGSCIGMSLHLHELVIQPYTQHSLGRFWFTYLILSAFTLGLDWPSDLKQVRLLQVTWPM